MIAFEVKDDVFLTDVQQSQNDIFRTELFIYCGVSKDILMVCGVVGLEILNESRFHFFYCDFLFLRV